MIALNKQYHTDGQTNYLIRLFYDIQNKIIGCPDQATVK